MPEWLKSLWTDSVGSKVIAGLIVTGILAIIAWIKRQPLTRLWKYIFNWPTIKLTIINRRTVVHPGANYPLKHYVEFRNDSRVSVEVRLSQYTPNAITIKRFVHEVLQLRFYTNWFPIPDGAPIVGMFRGQLCQAWLGINDETHTEAQVKSCEGKMGKLTVIVNDKEYSFDL
jgi:hypothetical protein